MQLLRPREVMVRLALSRGKVYQMIRDGVIPAVNIGGCLRIPEELLNKLIREQLAKKAGEAGASVEGLHVFLAVRPKGGK